MKQKTVNENKLSYSLVCELLDYNPSTGKLTWKVNKGGIKAGSYAGSIKDTGYIRVVINNTAYKAHRLIWFMVTGNWPKEEIDHINGNPSDNKWINLREITNSENLKNQKKQSNNRSGFNGVYWNNQRKKWQAQIQINKKNIYLGLFNSFEQAKTQRQKANKKYGFTERHGN
jgi:hypothetical protein